MKKSILLWLIAFFLTVATAVYQRVTGPTYPVSGKVYLGDELINYRLDRTHSGEGGHPVEIKVNDEKISGLLNWKRYKTNDDWTSVEMKREDGNLIASLPHQPPAGKLLYKVVIKKDDKVAVVPVEEGVIIRFKGDVPIFFLIPHIIFIFGAMLLSTRTGLEYFSAKVGYASGVNEAKKFKPLTIWTFIFVIIGGFIFGPIVQHYAFGAFWTGFPFGYDLTDNKVLIGFIAWLLALISLYKFKNPKRWIVSASLIMFIIFLIPHSVLGSELDYSKSDQNKIINESGNQP